jgi:uncharacterized OsmC-like protein
MQAYITFQGNLKFEASTRNHRILSDQPLSNGGEDLGMTPPELFLSALGSCVGFYAVKYLEARHLDPSQLAVEISAEKTKESPIRLDSIRIQVLPGIPLDERHCDGLTKAVDACILHHTLVHPPQMTTEIKLPLLAP